MITNRINMFLLIQTTVIHCIYSFHLSIKNIFLLVNREQIGIYISVSGRSQVVLDRCYSSTSSVHAVYWSASLDYFPIIPTGHVLNDQR